MRRIPIVIGFLLLTLSTRADAQTDSARYVVTLKEDVPPSAIEQLAIRYGGRVDALSSRGTRQFAVTMTPSGAQLLGGDARVTAVVPETPAASLSGRLHPASETYGSDGNSGAYSYDGSGNIIGIGADTFLYDAEGRLVRATVRGVQEDYVYDAFGNRTSATGATNCLAQSPCATTVTVSPSTNHLGGVSYNDAGSVEAASGATYTYDGTGMMTRSIAGNDDRQYVYTADDERIAVRQGVSWTWSVRDLSGKVLREFTSVEGTSLTQTTRQWIKDYVWRDGLLLASTDATGTYHYHLDHLGTPRLITDANHVRIAEHAYYPFGAEISITPHESSEEPMKFTGHERDIVAGNFLTLDYMHARYFSSTMGRFLALDPVEGEAHRPQSWNRYAYVDNNPVGMTDPTGLLGATITVTAPDPQREKEEEERKRKKEKERQFYLWIWSLVLHSAQQTWFGHMWYGAARHDTTLYYQGAAELFTMQTAMALTPIAGESEVIDTTLPAADEVSPEIQNTLQRIADGEAFPHRNDGSIFRNTEGRLPQQPHGYYHEYVHPTPGVPGPGARRVVLGACGEAYFTPDHYKTFIRIQ